MIAIVNITDNPQPTGVHRYSLRINRNEICQFEHNRELDLATCLELAAKAARTKAYTTNLQLLSEITKFGA